MVEPRRDVDGRTETGHVPTGGHDRRQDDAEAWLTRNAVVGTHDTRIVVG
jgi:hypothetical protein